MLFLMEKICSTTLDNYSNIICVDNSTVIYVNLIN